MPPFAKLYQGVRDPLNVPDEFDKLIKAVLGAPWDSSQILIDEPFVGLRAMREEESDLFFGRKPEIGALVEKFRKHRIIAVVADSGTGKSSLARAGFAPAFRGGALIDPVRDEARDKIWQVVTMRPRADPAEGLRRGVESAAQKLGRPLTDIASLRHSVSTADAGKTAFALRCGLPTDNTSTLLIVDQFEELFTSDIRPERRLFRRALACACRWPFGLPNPHHGAVRLFQSFERREGYGRPGRPVQARWCRRHAADRQPGHDASINPCSGRSAAAQAPT